MDNEKEKSLIRTILKNEITWLFFVVAGLMGFVTQVILPLQKMQIQLTHIQSDITTSKIDTATAIKEHLELRSRLDILETKFNNLR